MKEVRSIVRPWGNWRDHLTASCYYYGYGVKAVTEAKLRRIEMVGFLVRHRLWPHTYNPRV